MARRVGAAVVVDAAQSVPHLPVDVRELDCDFLAFSGHKMLGPMGIGVLYGRREFLEQMPPFMTGGEMVREVELESATWNDVPLKFEAGTPNVAGAVALATAIDYFSAVGMQSIAEHEKVLAETAWQRLEKIEGIQCVESCCRLQRNRQFLDRPTYILTTSQRFSTAKESPCAPGTIALNRFTRCLEFLRP